MSMHKPEYLVVGVTHVDLAWKRGRAEMSEMYEIAVVRLLDALERYPCGYERGEKKGKYLKWLLARLLSLLQPALFRLKDISLARKLALRKSDD